MVTMVAVNPEARVRLVRECEVVSTRRGRPYRDMLRYVVLTGPDLVSAFGMDPRQPVAYDLLCRT